jgi:hypothetical protein
LVQQEGLCGWRVLITPAINEKHAFKGSSSGAKDGLNVVEAPIGVPAVRERVAISRWQARSILREDNEPSA